MVYKYIYIQHHINGHNNTISIMVKSIVLLCCMQWQKVVRDTVDPKHLTKPTKLTLLKASYLCFYHRLV